MAYASLMYNIPAEIENIIISNLEPGADIALSLVNRYYNQLLGHHRRNNKESMTHYLHMMELKGRHARDHEYACFFCFRLKPRTEFTKSNVRRPRGKGGAEWATRWCLSCGIEHGKFRPPGVLKMKGSTRRYFP